MVFTPPDDCSTQGTGMSFKYYDIPMFALNDEEEVDYLLEVLAGI